MRKITFSLFLLLFLFLLSSSSLAQVPSTINYQGVLRNNTTNELLDGSYDMTFSIYPSPEGGDISSAQWSESHPAVQVANGLYSVQLGNAKPTPNPIDPAIFDGQTKYLEVIVNGQSLSPLIPLISVPYAFRAEVTETFSPAALPDPIVPADSVQNITGSLEVSGNIAAGGAVVDPNYGVYGESSLEGGVGVYGYATSASGPTVGTYGIVESPQGFAGYFTGGQGVYIHGTITTKTQKYTSGPIDMQPVANSVGAIFVEVSGPSGAIITLPSASASTVGKVYHIYNRGTSTIALNPPSGSYLIGEMSTSDYYGVLRVIGYDDDTWLSVEL